LSSRATLWRLANELGKGRHDSGGKRDENGTNRDEREVNP